MGRQGCATVPTVCVCVCVRVCVCVCIYSNPESVTDELVDIVHAPSCHRNAREVFVSVFTGKRSIHSSQHRHTHADTTRTITRRQRRRCSLNWYRLLMRVCMFVCGVVSCPGPPGPKPFGLVSRIQVPILTLWGEDDKLTPADGPVGRFFQVSTKGDSGLSVYLGIKSHRCRERKRTSRHMM